MYNAFSLQRCYYIYDDVLLYIHIYIYLYRVFIRGLHDQLHISKSTLYVTRFLFFSCFPSHLKISFAVFRWKVFSLEIFIPLEERRNFHRKHFFSKPYLEKIFIRLKVYFSFCYSQSSGRKIMQHKVSSFHFSGHY